MEYPSLRNDKSFLRLLCNDLIMLDTKTPRRVLLFSGKRKTGKDHLTEYLLKVLRESELKQSPDEKNVDCLSTTSQVDNVVILRLSGPLKRCYAENNGLDFKTLLSADTYKEKHRLDMIKWSEEIR